MTARVGHIIDSNDSVYKRGGGLGAAELPVTRNQSTLKPVQVGIDFCRKRVHFHVKFKHDLTQMSQSSSPWRSLHNLQRAACYHLMHSLFSVQIGVLLRSRPCSGCSFILNSCLLYVSHCPCTSSLDLVVIYVQTSPIISSLASDELVWFRKKCSRGFRSDSWEINELSLIFCFISLLHQHWGSSPLKTSQNKQLHF